MSELLNFLPFKRHTMRTNRRCLLLLNAKIIIWINHQKPPITDLKFHTWVTSKMLKRLQRATPVEKIFYLQSNNLYIAIWRSRKSGNWEQLGIEVFNSSSLITSGLKHPSCMANWLSIFWKPFNMGKDDIYKRNTKQWQK